MSDLPSSTPLDAVPPDSAAVPTGLPAPTGALGPPAAAGAAGAAVADTPLTRGPAGVAPTVSPTAPSPSLPATAAAGVVFSAPVVAAPTETVTTTPPRSELPQAPPLVETGAASASTAAPPFGAVSLPAASGHPPAEISAALALPPVDVSPPADVVARPSSAQLPASPLPSAGSSPEVSTVSRPSGAVPPPTSTLPASVLPPAGSWPQVPPVDAAPPPGAAPRPNSTPPPAGALPLAGSWPDVERQQLQTSLSHSPAWLPVALVVMAVLVGIALTFAWRAQQRVKTVEQELVARHGSSLEQTTEARVQAQQAQEVARASMAKLAVIELRLGEVIAQRGQLEELIVAASRPKEESLVGDTERALRMALQQSAVSGSVEPVVLALRQAEERLGGSRQPRLEPLRRAIARVLERARAGGSADMATLTGRVDEAIRMVDELPLLAAANTEADRGEAGRPVPGTTGPRSERAPAAPPVAGWWPDWAGAEIGQALLQRVWGELRSLIRVTRIDHPEAMLLAPEQSFFLRENLKLRLLNARLALLSRQFETARADLLLAEGWLMRYFDASSRRTGLAVDLLRQVRAQAQAGSMVRPDDTLAALAAAAAAR